MAENTARRMPFGPEPRGDDTVPMDVRLDKARKRREEALRDVPPSRAEPSRPWESEATATIVPWPGLPGDLPPVQKRAFDERLETLKKAATGARPAPILDPEAEPGDAHGIEVAAKVVAPATPRRKRPVLVASVCLLAVLPVLGYLAVPSETATTGPTVSALEPLALAVGAAGGDAAGPAPVADPAVRMQTEMAGLPVPGVLESGVVAATAAPVALAALSSDNPFGALPAFSDAGVSRALVAAPEMASRDAMPLVAGRGFSILTDMPGLAGPVTVADAPILSGVADAGPAMPNPALLGAAMPEEGLPAVSLAAALPDVWGAVPLLALNGATDAAPVGVGAEAAAPLPATPPLLATAAPDAAHGGGEAPLADASLTPLRVIVLMPDQSDPEVAATYGARVAQQGHDLRDVQAVPYTIGESNLRYYHAQDAAAAQALAATLGVTARDFTSFRPSPLEGSVELWVNGQAAPQVARAAPVVQRRGVVVEQPRERRGLFARLFGGGHAMSGAEERAHQDRQRAVQRAQPRATTSRAVRTERPAPATRSAAPAPSRQVTSRSTTTTRAQAPATSRQTVTRSAAPVRSGATVTPERVSVAAPTVTSRGTTGTTTSSPTPERFGSSDSGKPGKSGKSGGKGKSKDSRGKGKKSRDDD